MKNQFNKEAEAGILGCIMEDPSTCLPMVTAAFKGQPDFLYDHRHAKVFHAMLSLEAKGHSIDMISLQSELGDSNILESIGGISFLFSLQESVPSAENLPTYMELAREKVKERKLVAVAAEIATMATAGEMTPDELGDRMESMIIEANQEGEAVKEPTMKENVRGAMDLMEEMAERRGALVGLSTGLPDLDRITGGLKPREHYVIAARPSIGKTSLGMNIAEHIATQCGQSVGILTAEMDAESLTVRMIGTSSGVNIKDITDGFLKERDFPKLSSAAGKLSRAPIHIRECFGASIMEVRAKGRRLVRQNGAKILVVDYLQKLVALDSRGRRMDNREREVAEISAGLTQMSKELGVPVLSLCQLNRETEKNKGRKPNLSDLRESGAIEQDADLVGILYKVPEDDEEPDTENVRVNLLIAKQRNGPTGEIALLFRKATTRFTLAAKISDAEIPERFRE